MFTKGIAWILGSSLLLIDSCSTQVESPLYSMLLKTLLSHNIPEVSVEHAARLQNTFFIDVRSAEEFNVSHIKNARWVGYEEFRMEKMNAVSKDQPMVVYCSIGYRSEKIGKKLIEAGYKRVSNLYGGIFEWVNRGKPIYKTGNKPTDDIHPYSTVWGVWLSEGNKKYR